MHRLVKDMLWGPRPRALARARRADRGAWRAMLRSGEAPMGFRQAPPVPVPMPISHFLVRPRRAAAVPHQTLQRGQRATMFSCLSDYSN